MQTEFLNQLLGLFSDLKLSKFDDDGISKTTLPEGGILFLSLVSNSVLAYIKLERLGLKSSNKEIFEDLLASNLVGGEFGNIRIAYDKDTTVVWLCYNIMLDDLNATSFEKLLKFFITNAMNYRALLLSKILSNLFSDSEGATSFSSEFASSDVNMLNQFNRPQLASETSTAQSAASTTAKDDEELVVDKILQQALFLMA
jgi:hypothetical protein